jgi:pyrimidine operon attenuation protein / uracil phosphoribosyltransferase
MTTGPLSLDAQALYQDLKEGVRALLTPHTHVVGITSGGAWLAKRLHQDLSLVGECGVITSSMHRDDYGERGLSGGAASELPFEVTGSDILLIDDVLYTGRTIRAVLNELYDFGRPARVRLAVLVDRAGRELPIEANYAAARLSLTKNQTLSLALDASGEFHFSLEN